LHLLAIAFAFTSLPAGFAASLFSPPRSPSLLPAAAATALFGLAFICRCLLGAWRFFACGPTRTALHTRCWTRCWCRRHIAATPLADSKGGRVDIVDAHGSGDDCSLTRGVRTRRISDAISVIFVALAADDNVSSQQHRQRRHEHLVGSGALCCAASASARRHSVSGGKRASKSKNAGASARGIARNGVMAAASRRRRAASLSGENGGGSETLASRARQRKSEAIGGRR